MSLFLSTKTRRLSTAEPLLSMATSMTSTWPTDNMTTADLSRRQHRYEITQQEHDKITDAQYCRFTYTKENQQMLKILFSRLLNKTKCSHYHWVSSLSVWLQVINFSTSNNCFPHLNWSLSNLHKQHPYHPWPAAFRFETRQKNNNYHTNQTLWSTGFPSPRGFPVVASNSWITTTAIHQSRYINHLQSFKEY